MNPNPAAYRAALVVAVVAALVLVWLSLGVGIIGADGDPANAMYLAVLTIGSVVAAIARFRPAGMARAAFAVAIGLVAVTVIALTAGLGGPASPPLEIVSLGAFFVATFVGSGALFRRAAPERR